MKTSILKKLLLFLILVFAVIRATAQIVYTNVDPDQSIFTNGSVYHFDLNNDGIADFDFSVTTQLTSTGRCFGTKTNYEFLVTPLNGNKVLYINGINKISMNVALSPTSASGGYANQYLMSDYWACTAGADYVHSWHLFYYNNTWANTTDGYLGLRLSLNGKKFYGWLRMDCNNTSLTFKDYAFNSLPNDSILTGQTCPPQSVITANGPTTFCLGDSVILSSANSGTNLSYKWKLNGSNLTGATNKSFTAKVAGKYKVNVKDNTNGCSAKSSVVKMKVPCRVLNEELSVDENVLLKVFPNPFSQSTTISFALLQSEKVSLKIFDVEGRLIRTLVNEPMSAGTHKLTWDAQNSPDASGGNEVNSGIYFIELKTDLDLRVIRLSVIRSHNKKIIPFIFHSLTTKN